MKSMQIVIEKKELCFFVAFFLYMNFKMVVDTLFINMFNFSRFNMPVFVVVVALLVFQITFDEIRTKTLPVILFILAVFMFVGLRWGNIRDLVMLVLFVFSARNIDFDKMLKFAINIIGFWIALSFALYAVGFFSGVDEPIYRSDGTVRNSLGFRYTTFAPNYFMSFVLGWLYLNRDKKLNGKLVIFFLLVNAFLFVFTDTRVVFYEVTLLLILGWFISRKPTAKTQFKKPTAFVALITPTVCAIASFFFAIFYNSGTKWMAALDRWLNYRIGLMHAAYLQYGFKLFGNPVEFIREEDEYMFIDCSYVNIGLRHGLVILILVLVGVTLLLNDSLKKNSKMALLVYMFVCIHGITDPQLFQLAYNPFLLNVGIIVFGSVALRANKPVATTQT